MYLTIFAIDEDLFKIASDIQAELNGQNQFEEPSIPISFEMCLKIIDRALKNQQMLEKVISPNNTQLSTAINSIINNQNSNNTKDINDLKDKTTGISYNNTSKSSIDGVNILNLKSQVDTLNSENLSNKLDILGGDIQEITDFKNTVTTNEANIITLQSNILDLQTSNTNNEANITDLQSSNTTNQANITSLQTSNTTNRANITSLQSSNIINQSNISTLQDKTTGITYTVQNKTSIDGINFSELNAQNHLYSKVLDNLRYIKQTTGLSSGLTAYPTTQLSTLPDLTILSDYMTITGLKASNTFIAQDFYNQNFWSSSMNLNGSYCNAIVGDNDVCISLRGTVVLWNMSASKFLPRLVFNLNQPISQTIRAFSFNGLFDDTNFVTNPPLENGLTTASNLNTLINSQYIYAKNSYFQLYVLRVSNQDIVIVAIDKTLFYFLSASDVMGFNKSGCMYMQIHQNKSLTNVGAFASKPFTLGYENPNDLGSYWDCGVNNSIYPLHILQGFSLNDKNVFKDIFIWTFGDKDFYLGNLYTYIFEHNSQNTNLNQALVVKYNSDNTIKHIQLWNPDNNSQTATYDFS